MDPDPAPKYAPFFGHVWVILSIIVGLVLLSMFFFGPELMNAGRVTWTLLRWLASPVI